MLQLPKFKFIFTVLIFSTVLIVSSGNSSRAGEYKFCLLVNQQASANALRQFTDGQIKNGVCMLSKELITAIMSGNSTKEELCHQSMTAMSKEFHRRFPKEDLKSTTGRC